MPFVNKSGGEGEEESADVAAGAPPAFDGVELDLNDPDQVKVHYNLSGWSFDQRAELAETLAEAAVPHGWAGEELVIPEVIEADVDALFDELEREIGPFPITLDEGEESTEFGLDEWPVGDLETLKASLVEAEIPHRWEGRQLIVAHDAEHTVDELLDAIEAGDVVSLDGETEAPDGALQSIYTAADRLARDATDAKGRATVLELVPQLSKTSPPFGLAAAAWGTIVERADALNARFHENFEDADIIADARELRDVCRPYV